MAGVLKVRDPVTGLWLVVGSGPRGNDGPTGATGIAGPTGPTGPEEVVVQPYEPLPSDQWEIFVDTAAPATSPPDLFVAKTGDTMTGDLHFADGRRTTFQQDGFLRSHPAGWVYNDWMSNQNVLNGGTGYAEIGTPFTVTCEPYVMYEIKWNATVLATIHERYAGVRDVSEADLSKGWLSFQRYEMPGTDAATAVATGVGGAFLLYYDAQVTRELVLAVRHGATGDYTVQVTGPNAHAHLSVMDMGFVQALTPLAAQRTANVSARPARIGED